MVCHLRRLHSIFLVDFLTPSCPFFAFPRWSFSSRNDPL
jgi:hypothetical protein